MSIQLNIVTRIQRNSYETMLLDRFYNFPLSMSHETYQNLKRFTGDAVPAANFAPFLPRCRFLHYNVRFPLADSNVYR